MLDELHVQGGFDQKYFDLNDAVDAFQRSLDGLRADGATAKAAAKADLIPLAEDPKAVELVMRVAEGIALADGDVSPQARAAVAEVAGALGVSALALGLQQARPDTGACRVIVVGNEKGGTGKSTTAIHIAMGLASQGAKVACLDLDSRQATLSRFLANRATAAQHRGVPLVVPRYRRVDSVVAESEDAATAEEQARFNAVLSELAHHDALVIDTPGHASRLAQFAHAAADVLVTPINDSFIDVDALADIDLPRREVRAPSPYCRSVWRERDRRKLAGEAEVDWLVARNRIGHLDSRSTREMARLLSVLSERLGFRLQPGFSERVIFRELFFRGLTLFDLVDEEVPHGSHASLARARQEVGELLAAVGTSAGRV
jgi:chromosome partitioning protein